MATLLKSAFAVAGECFGPLMIAGCVWSWLVNALPLRLSQIVGSLGWPVMIGYTGLLVARSPAITGALRHLRWLVVICASAVLFAAVYVGIPALPLAIRLPLMFIGSLALWTVSLAPSLSVVYDLTPFAAFRQSARILLEKPGRFIIFLFLVYVPPIALAPWLAFGMPYHGGHWQDVGKLLFGFMYALTQLPVMGLVVAFASGRVLDAQARPYSQTHSVLQGVSAVFVPGVLGALVNLLTAIELSPQTFGIGVFLWLPAQLAQYLAVSLIDLAIVVFSCAITAWASYRIAANRWLAALAGVLCGAIFFEMAGRHFGSDWITGRQFSYVSALLYITGLVFRGGLTLGVCELLRRIRPRQTVHLHSART